MKYYVCYGCGTHMKTGMDYRTPSELPWNDGHICNFVEDFNQSAQNEVAIELRNIYMEMQDMNKSDKVQNVSTDVQLVNMETRLKSLEETLFLMKHKDDA